MNSNALHRAAKAASNSKVACASTSANRRRQSGSAAPLSARNGGTMASRSDTLGTLSGYVKSGVAA